MKNIFKVLSFALLAFTFACSGSQKTMTSNTKTSANSNYPSWYGGFEFSTDSTLFTARATAISDDKEKAQLRAEKEARGLLESYIGKELEDIRKELERDGSTVVQKPDFILKLRNAQLNIQNQATLSNSEVIQSKEVYRAFVSVQISKAEVRSLIQNGLSSNTAYQREYINSISFTELLLN